MPRRNNAMSAQESPPSTSSVSHVDDTERLVVATDQPVETVTETTISAEGKKASDVIISHGAEASIIYQFEEHPVESLIETEALADGQDDGQPKRSLEALFQAAHSELQNFSKEDENGNESSGRKRRRIEIVTPTGQKLSLPASVIDKPVRSQVVLPEVHPDVIGTPQTNEGRLSLGEGEYVIVQSGEGQEVNQIWATMPSTSGIPGAVTQQEEELQAGAEIAYGVVQEAASSSGTGGRRRKHPQRPGKHMCPYCGKGCSKPSVLEKHIRAHTGERPFPCKACDISFKTKSNLYKHCKSRAHAIVVGLVSESTDRAKGLLDGSDGSDSDEEESRLDVEMKHIGPMGKTLNPTTTTSSKSTTLTSGGQLVIVKSSVERSNELAGNIVSIVPAASSETPAAVPKHVAEAAPQPPAIHAAHAKLQRLVSQKSLEKVTPAASDASTSISSGSASSMVQPLFVVKDATANQADGSTKTVRLIKIVRPNQSEPSQASTQQPHTPQFAPPAAVAKVPPATSLAAAQIKVEKPVTGTSVMPDNSSEIIEKNMHTVSSEHPALGEPAKLATSSTSSKPLAVKPTTPTSDIVTVTSTLKKYADNSMEVTIQLPKPKTTTAGSSLHSVKTMKSSDMTPEKLQEHISWLISNNAAIVDTPMAEAPRPKRVSRQNSQASLNPVGRSTSSVSTPPIARAMTLPFSPSASTATLVSPGLVSNPVTTDSTLQAQLRAAEEAGQTVQILQVPTSPQQHFLGLAEPSDQPPGQGLVKVEVDNQEPNKEETETASAVEKLEACSEPHHTFKQHSPVAQPMIGQPAVQFPGQPVMMNERGELIVTSSSSTVETVSASDESSVIRDLLMKNPNVRIVAAAPPGRRPPLERQASVDLNHPPSDMAQFQQLQESQTADVKPKSPTRPILWRARSTSSSMVAVSSTVPTMPVLTPAKEAQKVKFLTSQLPSAPSPVVFSPDERPRLKLNIPPVSTRPSPATGTPTPGGPSSSKTDTPPPDWKLKLKGRLLMKRSMSVERMLKSQEQEARLTKGLELEDLRGQTRYAVQNAMLRRAESLDESAIVRKHRKLQHQPHSVDASMKAPEPASWKRQSPVQTPHIPQTSGLLSIATEPGTPIKTNQVIVMNEETGVQEVILLADTDDEKHEDVHEASESQVAENPGDTVAMILGKIPSPSKFTQQKKNTSMTSLPVNINNEVFQPAIGVYMPRVVGDTHHASHLPFSSILKCGNKQVLRMLQFILAQKDGSFDKSSEDNIPSSETTPGKDDKLDSEDIDKDKTSEGSSRSRQTSPKFLVSSDTDLPESDVCVATYENLSVRAPKSLQKKVPIALLLLGHSHLSLWGTNHVTFCSVMKPQPMYVPQGANRKLSMYSNWRTVSVNPNPLGLSSKNMLNLHHTRLRELDPLYINADTSELKGGIFTHSSYWMYREKDRKGLEARASSRPVKLTSFPEIMMSLDASNKMTTPNAETPRGETKDWIASPLKDKLRESLINSSQEDKPIHLTKVFPGGYKSDEAYTYIRGRGYGKYICEECGIRCKKPSMLKKHIRTHTDLRPYQCRYCSFSFKTKGNLTKHMKSKTHHRKCMQLGIFPVPTCVDQTHIDSRILAAQNSVIRDEENVPGQTVNKDGKVVYIDLAEDIQVVEEEVNIEDHDEEDEDEEEEGEIEEEIVEEDSIDVEETMVIDETATGANISVETDHTESAPQYIAMQQDGVSQPTIVRVAPEGTSIMEATTVITSRPAVSKKKKVPTATRR